MQQEMQQQTPTIGKIIKEYNQKSSSPDAKDQVRFPILKLQNVKEKQKEHQALLKELFPKPVRLSKLIIDIEKNFAQDIASIIGSVDFAKERLAGLISALKEFESQIATANYVNLEEVKEQIRQDNRIHQSLEELVFESVQHSVEYHA